LAQIVKHCLAREGGYVGTVSRPAPPASKSRIKQCRNHFLIGGGVVGNEADRVVRLVVASPIDYWKTAANDFLLWD
jgi:hypothetical protein